MHLGKHKGEIAINIFHNKGVDFTNEQVKLMTISYLLDIQKNKGSLLHIGVKAGLIDINIIIKIGYLRLQERMIYSI